MKIEKIIIAVLGLLIVWFGATIVRLENYHYAVQVGFCQEYRLPDRGEHEACLNGKETRTSWVFNLFYGLGVL